MPSYCYTTKGGETVERQFPMMDDHPEMIVLDDGRVAFRDFAAEAAGGSPPGNWPQYSDAMGVGESQIHEAMAESVKLGVPTEFNQQGQAVFTSARHRKKYAEANGFYDRNAGYSDPLPKNRT